MSTTAIDSTTLVLKIADSLKSAGKKGVTVSELVTSTGGSKQAITAQLNKLKKNSLVILTGAYRAGPSGSPSPVYAPAKGIRIVSAVKNLNGGSVTKTPRPKKSQAAAPVAPTPAPTVTTPTPTPVPVPVQTSNPNVVQNTKLKNHYILVCDGSGSMDEPRGKPNKIGAAALFNEQLDVIQKVPDQENTATIFHFGVNDGRNPSGIKEIRYNTPLGQTPRFKTGTGTDYPAEGGTPLYAAVIKAGQRAMCDQDSEKSFVMVVLTDGEENRSKQDYQIDEKQLQEFIRDRQATDRWTFVFLVPKGYKSAFVKISGVHEGNVQEWDDIDKAREELTRGAERYIEGRRAGRRNSKNWFTTDLSHIDAKILSQLKDVTDEVRTITVDHEQEISLFVGEKTGGTLVPLHELDANGNQVMENGKPKPLVYERGAFKGQQKHKCDGGKFQPGRSFFEIMKKEDKIQDYKKFLLLDKGSKRIYADGPNLSVRAACNLPLKGDVAVEPGNHANLVLAAQSMSDNRHLSRGTKLLFWEDGNK